MHDEADVLAAVLVARDLGEHLHVDRELTDALADLIEDAPIDLLIRRRVRLPVLDPDQQPAARAVREANRRLRELHEARTAPDDHPQRLALEALALAIIVHRSASVRSEQAADDCSDTTHGIRDPACWIVAAARRQSTHVSSRAPPSSS